MILNPRRLWEIGRVGKYAGRIRQGARQETRQLRGPDREPGRGLDSQARLSKQVARWGAGRGQVGGRWGPSGGQAGGCGSIMPI